MSLIENETLIFVDNQSELDFIFANSKNLKVKRIYLTSGNFHPIDLPKYNNIEVNFIDQNLSDVVSKKINDITQKIIWNWFLDENKSDLSILNGVSTGAAFAPSLEISFTSAIKYYFLLQSVLNSNSQVIICSSMHPYFSLAINSLKRELKFNLKVIQNSNDEPNISKFSDGQIFDPSFRDRDLKSVFKEESYHSFYLKKYFLKILSYFNRSSSGMPKVMYLGAGKEEQFYNYIKFNKTGISWLIPITRRSINSSLILRNNSSVGYYFHRMNLRNKSTDEVSLVSQALLENLSLKVFNFDLAIIKAILEKKFFDHLSGVLSYINGFSSLIAEKNPDLVISSVDSYPDYMIAVQIAKSAKIRTCFMHHGLSFYGIKHYRKGRFKFFDYALATSKMDEANFIQTGFSKEEIVPASLPYFFSFLPIKKQTQKVNHSYKKALLLVPDVYSASNEIFSGNSKFLNEIIDLFDSLNIEIAGIKFREKIFATGIGIFGDFIKYENKRIQLYYGEKSFREIAKFFDLIIGPPSSATIEASLLNVDYFSFLNKKYFKHTNSILPIIDSFFEISYSKEDLANNIMCHKVFKNNRTINDVINLSENKEQGMKSFVESIKDVINLRG